MQLAYPSLLLMYNKDLLIGRAACYRCWWVPCLAPTSERLTWRGVWCHSSTSWRGCRTPAAAEGFCWRGGGYACSRTTCCEVGLAQVPQCHSGSDL